MSSVMTIRNYPPELEAEKTVDFKEVLHPAPPYLATCQCSGQCTFSCRNSLTSSHSKPWTLSYVRTAEH